MQPLAIQMHNEIPLGMGCGSSAAGRTRGNCYGGALLGICSGAASRYWKKPARLKGIRTMPLRAGWVDLLRPPMKEGQLHGLRRIASRVAGDRCSSRRIAGNQCGAGRAAGCYSSDDVVANLQSVSMLGLAFARAAAICCASRWEIDPPTLSI